MTYEEAEAEIRWSRYIFNEPLDIHICEILSRDGFIVRGIVLPNELCDHKEVSRLRAISKLIDIKNRKKK